MDYHQEVAVEAYRKSSGRTFVPGDVVTLPIDALVFAEYQKPWLSLEEFKAKRCTYDPETNDWLVDFVTNALRGKRGFSVPAIYVDILDDGIALVDGAHRVTCGLIWRRSRIVAQLNQL